MELKPEREMFDPEPLDTEKPHKPYIPDKSGYQDYIHGVCPNCTLDLGVDWIFGRPPAKTPKYCPERCPRCGQRLDWSDY